MEFLLRPYVKSSESFIIDSQNLIQKLRNLSFPEDSQIVTGDF